MNSSQGLLVHALQLLAMNHSGRKSEEMQNVTCCRAVSAAYYALFHHINGAAAALIAPNVPSETNHRIQLWFEHAEMKKVCGRFLQAKLDQPLRNLIGDTASSEMQNVASSFIKLQEARHTADYDLSCVLSLDEAQELTFIAAGAMHSWDSIANTAEANIFILSLLMWKNWEKER